MARASVLAIPGFSHACMLPGSAQKAKNILLEKCVCICTFKKQCHPATCLGHYEGPWIILTNQQKKRSRLQYPAGFAEKPKFFVKPPYSKPRIYETCANTPNFIWYKGGVYICGHICLIIWGASNYMRPRKKIFVFHVTRPTHGSLLGLGYGFWHSGSIFSVTITKNLILLRHEISPWNLASKVDPTLQNLNHMACSLPTSNEGPQGHWNLLSFFFHSMSKYYWHVSWQV